MWKVCDKEIEKSLVMPTKQKYGAHMKAGPIKKEFGKVFGAKKRMASREQV